MSFGISLMLENTYSRNLKIIELVCFGMSLQCTIYEHSISRDSGSKIKKPIIVANLAQSKVFESLVLEA